MRIVVRLPMPNQSMNNGTRAKEGIGISALTSGRQKPSIALKRAIRIPSGMPTTTARLKPNITRYIVKAACSMMLPSANIANRVFTMAGMVGSKASPK